MSVLRWPEALHTQELKKRVSEAKVLVVGAGGIGCELLKCLVLSGYEDIEVIDLDTIEVSNLNRQFLFRKKHVGQSKAKVAAEAVRSMRPNIKIVAHHANVKESRFDVDFFRRFKAVLNGLDNLDARRHVNRMCLAACVPLVESGTAGFLGQTSVHIAGITECFDCQPKPRQKSYAVCTIRTSPDKPIHCIVWAKDLLFQRLFGPRDDDNDVDTTGQMDLVDGESTLDYAKKVFDAAFGSSIQDILKAASSSEEDMFKGRMPPKPIFLKDLAGKENSPLKCLEAAADNEGTAGKALGLTNHHDVWSVSQNAALFLESTRRLLKERASEIGSMTVDKDDHLAMEFVTAAANLRAACYHIPLQTFFDAKGMAGNIIHAIATTNSIIAGLIVQESLKLLAAAGDPNAIKSSCRSTFLLQNISNRRMITPVNLETPNTACVVCGKAKLEIRLDTSSWTLGAFIRKIAKDQLSMIAPTLSYGQFLYEEGEDLDPEEVEHYSQHLGKVLAELPSGGVVHNSVIELSDQSQSLNVEIIVCHQSEWDERKYPEKFQFRGEIPVAETEDKDNEIKDEINAERVGMKRTRPEVVDQSGAIVLDEEDESKLKKPKHIASSITVNQEDCDGPIEILD